MLRGMEYQMGYDTQVNHGVSIEALVQVIEYIKTDADACDNKAEANDFWKVG